MTKRLLAGAAAIAMLSGVAYAQTYPPAPPPAIVVPAPVPPATGGYSSSTTTTVAPVPGADYRTSTTKKGVDAYGNTVTEKNTYKSGAGGSTQTHTKTETDPYAGNTTTRSTTTTTPP